MNFWSPNPVTRWRFTGDTAKSQSMRQVGYQLMGVLKSMNAILPHKQRKLTLSDGGTYRLISRPGGQDEIWIDYPEGGGQAEYDPYFWFGVRHNNYNPKNFFSVPYQLAFPVVFVYEPSQVNDLGETVLGELLAAPFHHASNTNPVNHPPGDEWKRSDNVEEFYLGRAYRIKQYIKHTSNNFCLSEDAPWDPKNGNLDEDYNFDSELKWACTGWLDPKDPEKTWTVHPPVFFPEEDEAQSILSGEIVWKSSYYAYYDSYACIKYEDDTGEQDLALDDAIWGMVRSGPGAPLDYLKYIKLAGDPETLPEDWSLKGKVLPGWYVIKIGALATGCAEIFDFTPEVEIRLGRGSGQFVRRYTLPNIFMASAWFRDTYPYGWYTTNVNELDDAFADITYGPNPHGYSWWQGAFLVNIEAGVMAALDVTEEGGQLDLSDKVVVEDSYLPDDDSFDASTPATPLETEQNGFCNDPYDCIDPGEYVTDPVVNPLWKIEGGDRYGQPGYLFIELVQIICLKVGGNVDNPDNAPYAAGWCMMADPSKEWYGEMYQWRNAEYDLNSQEEREAAAIRFLDFTLGGEGICKGYVWFWEDPITGLPGALQLTVEPWTGFS